MVALCLWPFYASAQTPISPTASMAPNAPLQNGGAIFQMRCAICHGSNADGQSDLARIMRPPPANLRASKLSDAERSEIVRKGGAAVNRSANMPVWELELREEELRAVLLYVGSLKQLHP